MGKHDRRIDDSKVENNLVAGFKSQMLWFKYCFWTDSCVEWGYHSPDTWVSTPSHESAICSWNRYTEKEEQFYFIVNRFEGKINTKISPLKFTIFYNSLWTTTILQFKKSTKRDLNGWVRWIPRSPHQRPAHRKLTLKKGCIFVSPGNNPHSFSWEILGFFPRPWWKVS